MYRIMYSPVLRPSALRHRAAAASFLASAIDADRNSNGFPDAAPSQLPCRFVTVVRGYVRAMTAAMAVGVAADFSKPSAPKIKANEREDAT
jgi:hypothetical protein